MTMKQTRYFKVINSATYKGDSYGKIYPLTELRHDGKLVRLQTDFATNPLNFYDYEVEEVFDYTSTHAFSRTDCGMNGQSKQIFGENKRVFETGSVRDNDDNKPLPFELHPYMLLRYGYHMKTGQLNYGKGNWQLTQPDVDVWESGGRHFAQALLCFQDPELAKELGLDQEDHLSALLFFINMLMQNEAKRGIKPNHYFKGKTK